MTFLFQKKQDTLDTFEPYLIVGLGNPGRDYRETRHNIGFMVIDRLSEVIECKLIKVQSKAIIGIGKIGDQKVILAKPQT
ncbi:MAG: hypothetical protein ACD_34C00598G0001, partial [uncultured bacterium]